MARATIKKYRRKTMKSKSKGKKMKIKKTLKLKPKRRNGKKTQKRFRLKNKKRNVKRGGELGDEPGDKLPTKEDFTTYDASGNKIFDGPGFLKAMQKYNTKKISNMQVKDPEKERDTDHKSNTKDCTNVESSSSDQNEYGALDKHFLKFKFEGQDHIYCYNYSDIKADLNNIGNICCVWKKTIPDAEDNSEGYGTSCVVKNTRDLLNNVCDYINGVTSDLNTEGYEFVDGGENNYLCVWKSLINVRTWISQDAIKTINNYKSRHGIFILKKKQEQKMIIGNLYNVFGIGMLHGQQPGEYIYDIKFEPSVNITSTDIILEKDKLLENYDVIYNQFWNAPPALDLSYDADSQNDGDIIHHLNDISFDSTPPSTPPPRERGTNGEVMSPISPNRQLFDSPSILGEFENNSNYSPFIIHEQRPLTMEDLDTSWITNEENTSQISNEQSIWRITNEDMDTREPRYYTPPIVSIPSDGENLRTVGFVYLSPGSNLRPRSDRIGDTYDIFSHTPQDRTPPRRRPPNNNLPSFPNLDLDLDLDDDDRIPETLPPRPPN